MASPSIAVRFTWFLRIAIFVHAYFTR